MTYIAALDFIHGWLIGERIAGCFCVVGWKAWFNSAIGRQPEQFQYFG
jgi:hypothetical protein